MKKLLLLLAATNCCYFHANAGTYLTLSATSLLKPSASNSTTSVLDNIKAAPLPSISMGYDVFFSNFYIAFEQCIIPLALLKAGLSVFKEDISFVQLGYKIMDNVVLFVTGGVSIYGRTDAYGKLLGDRHNCFGVGVKYFDTSNNNLVYRAMWQHVTDSNFEPKTKAFILGVDYRI